jgi:hypothetical protein
MSYSLYERVEDHIVTAPRWFHHLGVKHATQHVLVTFWLTAFTGRLLLSALIGGPGVYAYIVLRKLVTGAPRNLPGLGARCDVRDRVRRRRAPLPTGLDRRAVAPGRLRHDVVGPARASDAMRRRCLCKCHEGGHGDRLRADGVDLCDAVEAVVACTQCRRAHLEAIAILPQASVHRPTIRAENGPANPYLPPTEWTGEDGG